MSWQRTVKAKAPQKFSHVSKALVVVKTPSGSRYAPSRKGQTFAIGRNAEKREKRAKA